MQRNPGELAPIGKAADLDADAPIRDDSPQARRGFTVADQVNRLVWASKADPDLGFMARMMALCSLPRANGPFTLYMNTTADNKLPYGNLGSE